MADPTGVDFSAVGNTLFQGVKTQIEGAATGFLSSHKDVEAWLLVASGRLAKASVLYWITRDAVEKADLAGQISDEKEAILEESDSILKDIQDSSGSLILSIIKTAFSIFADVAPLALKFI